MITLNKLAAKCREIALRKKIITKDSSDKGMALHISVSWRKLWDADNGKSVKLPKYSQKEVEAAEVIIQTITYLQSIGCKNIEQLIKDKIKHNENRTD